MSATEDLLKLMRENPPAPFVGFTVTPAAKAHFVEWIKNSFEPPSALSLFSANPNLINGVEFFVVTNQSEPVYKWTDRKKMLEYISAKGAL